MPVEYVETRTVPLDALTRFPGNAKRGNVDKIRESIREHDQYRSLVVQETADGLVILAGNHTYDALKAEQRGEARCEIVRCDDLTARKINLVDNRLPELGTYDNDALIELLSYLEGDYVGTGYDEDTVRRLIDGPDLPDSPEEFPEYDPASINTEHECPSCGYKWSGKSSS